MKILDLQQGTPEWHDVRAKCFTASEAPVMMNASSKMKRNELLHMKATGSAREVSAWVQKNLFDKGHAYEADARVITEEAIGEDLYPVTATDDEGWLLASFDGVNLMQTTLYEHKMWNVKLAEKVRSGELDPEYYWQLEQQLLVSGAEKVLFIVSDGTEVNRAELVYRPVPGRADELLAGWAQFEKDLKSYTPPVVKEETVAKTIANFPALAVQLVGEVKQSNVMLYKASALEFIKSVNTTLVNDQDFADAEATVKFFDKAEKELDVVKSQALSQTASISELFSTIDLLQEEMRKKRLSLNKLVTARKDEVRVEIRQTAEKAFAAHVAEINQQIGPRIKLPLVTTDFAAVMKNKRTLTSLQDAVDSELARAKIEADATAKTILINLAVLREIADHQRSLFPDAQTIITKTPEDFANLVKSRCAEAAEQERIRIEEQREAIRKQEADRLIREQEEAERIAREESAAAAKKAEQEDAERERHVRQQERNKDLANAQRLAKQEPSAEAKPVPVETQRPSIVADYIENHPRYHSTGTAKIANRVPARFELVNMESLLRDIVNGVMPMDLVQIVPDAVAEYIGEHGCAPTGFTMSGGQNG